MEQLEKYSQLINSLKQAYNKEYDFTCLGTNDIKTIIELYSDILSCYIKILEEINNSSEMDNIYKDRLTIYINNEIRKLNSLIEIGKNEIAKIILDDDERLILHPKLPVIPKELKKYKDKKDPEQKTNLAKTNNDEELKNKDQDLIELVEYFMLSPITYHIFCEYYTFLVNYDYNLNAINTFLKIIENYLESDEQAINILEYYIASLLRRNLLTKKELTNNQRLMNTIFEANLSGKIIEQIQKAEIKRLLQENNKDRTKAF